MKLLETLERAVAKLPRTSPPIPGPTDESRAALCAWAKDNGCACEHIRLERFDNGQTRVVAAATIAANDVVISVPACLAPARELTMTRWASRPSRGPTTSTRRSRSR